MELEAFSVAYQHIPMSVRFLPGGIQLETWRMVSLQIGSNCRSLPRLFSSLFSCFGMLRPLGKEAMALWLTVIPTSALDWVKYSFFMRLWGISSLQNHSSEQTYFTDRWKDYKCRASLLCGIWRSGKSLSFATECLLNNVTYSHRCGVRRAPLPLPLETSRSSRIC